MKHKLVSMANKSLVVILVLAALVLTYGMAVPRLLSAKDDVLVIIGTVIGLGIPVFGIYKLLKIAERRGGK